MNAYDFDNTIYDGESMYDFFFLCLSKDIRLFRYIPEVIYRLIQYKLNHLQIEYLVRTAEKVIASFLKRNKISLEALTDEFWQKNHHKLKSSFLAKLKQDDLIISGAPRFIIEAVQKELNTKHIICTEINPTTYRIEFLCLKDNKVKAFLEQYPHTKINQFYTDSLADVPMMKYAKETYLVKGNKITKIDQKN